MFTGHKKSISKEINFADHENMNMGPLNNHVCYATEVDDEHSAYAKDTDSHTAYIVSYSVHADCLSSFPNSTVFTKLKRMFAFALIISRIYCFLLGSCQHSRRVAYCCIHAIKLLLIK